MIHTIIFGLLVSFVCLGLFLALSTRKWKHDELGWGYPTGAFTPDPFQPTYRCWFCEDNLAQDSQGNYFHLQSKGDGI